MRTTIDANLSRRVMNSSAAIRLTLNAHTEFLTLIVNCDFIVPDPVMAVEKKKIQKLLDIAKEKVAEI